MLEVDKFVIPLLENCYHTDWEHTEELKDAESCNSVFCYYQDSICHEDSPQKVHEWVNDRNLIWMPEFQPIEDCFVNWIDSQLLCKLNPFSCFSLWI